MNPLILALKKTPIVYIARDLERAWQPSLFKSGYFIVTNYTPFAKKIAQKNSRVLLLKDQKILDTREILIHPKTIFFLQKITNPHIVVFKNTLAIEKICQEKGFTLLNPSARVAAHVEEKISQVRWLKELGDLLPPHKITLVKKLTFKGSPFIVQFNHGHTGDGTILIESETQLHNLINIFPERPVRVTQFLQGSMFTNNNIVWGNRILTGNINYQITGLAPFTERPFATIGNDWSLPHKLLSQKQITQFKKIATAVGKKLAKNGWHGLFGIDVLLEQKTGKLYLIEINARQPASTTYESHLQEYTQKKPTDQDLTVFQAHLAALLKCPIKKSHLIPINAGAQVIQKRILHKPSLPATIEKKLTQAGFNVIPYLNLEPESDWLRIQTTKGIMAAPGEFNKMGEKIKILLTHKPSTLQKK